MQFSQPFFVAGPPNCLQFYPCFTPPPQPQMYSGNGLSYNGPFQDVIGEGDVSSVVLPDGTVQLFFVPAPNTSAAKCPHCMQNLQCNACWDDTQNHNGPWFVRSVNNQSIAPPARLNLQNNRKALPCPAYQTNQGVKFHNDECTSTEDIGYFCPGSQQKYDEQRPERPCCAGVVCHAPCKCSANCVGLRPNPIYEGCDSDLSIDESRRGKKRKKRNVDCECVSDCSTNCQRSRKRHKKQRSDSSSSDSSSREDRKRREKARKACKKQCKKLEKERKKREKKREKCIKKEKRRRQKGKSDACVCTSEQDQQTCGQQANEPTETCPQAGTISGACSSLLCKLNSAYNYLTSNTTCNSQSSTCTSCTTSTSISDCSDWNDGEYESEKEWRKSSKAEKKQLKKEWKRIDAEQKRSEKELIKRNQRERKLKDKERKKQEKEEMKLLKLYSSKNGKKRCACNMPCWFQDQAAKHKTQSDCVCPPSNMGGWFRNPCSSAMHNNPCDQYGKGDKKHKTQSDCVCPPTNLKGCFQDPCLAERRYDPCDQYGKGDKKIKQSNCACPPSQRGCCNQYGKNDKGTKKKTGSDCACPSNLNDCFQDGGGVRQKDPCSQYSIGDKAKNHKKLSDCACPPNPNYCCSANQLNDYGKGDKIAKPKAKSDCACGSRTNQSDCSRDPYLEVPSKVKCSCSNMSIDTKPFSYDSDTRCKTGCLKIIDITEDPCRDIGTYCRGPTMSNKQLDTCGDVSKDSQRHCGVLCEGPTTANKQLATHADKTSTGILANIMEKLGIGIQCSDCNHGATCSPPPSSLCSSANSQSFLGHHTRDRDSNSCSCPRSPPCNPM